MTQRINTNGFAGQLFATDSTVGNVFVATTVFTVSSNLVLNNHFACDVARSNNGNSLAGQLFATDSTVDHVVIATVVDTIGSNLVFNNDFALSVTQCGNCFGIDMACIILTGEGLHAIGLATRGGGNDAFIVSMALCGAYISYSLGLATTIVTGSSLGAVCSTGCVVIRYKLGKLMLMGLDNQNTSVHSGGIIRIGNCANEQVTANLAVVQLIQIQDSQHNLIVCLAADFLNLNHQIIQIADCAVHHPFQVDCCCIDAIFDLLLMVGIHIFLGNTDLLHQIQSVLCFIGVGQDLCLAALQECNNIIGCCSIGSVLALFLPVVLPLSIQCIGEVNVHSATQVLQSQILINNDRTLRYSQTVVGQGQGELIVNQSNQLVEVINDQFQTCQCSVQNQLELDSGLMDAVIDHLLILITQELQIQIQSLHHIQSFHQAQLILSLDNKLVLAILQELRNIRGSCGGGSLVITSVLPEASPMCIQSLGQVNANMTGCMPNTVFFSLVKSNLNHRQADVRNLQDGNFVASHHQIGYLGNQSVQTGSCAIQHPLQVCSSATDAVFDLLLILFAQVTGGDAQCIQHIQCLLRTIDDHILAVLQEINDIAGSCGLGSFLAQFGPELVPVLLVVSVEAYIQLAAGASLPVHIQAAGDHGQCCIGNVVALLVSNSDREQMCFTVIHNGLAGYLHINVSGVNDNECHIATQTSDFVLAGQLILNGSSVVIVCHVQAGLVGHVGNCIQAGSQAVVSGLCANQFLAVQCNLQLHFRTVMEAKDVRSIFNVLVVQLNAIVVGNGDHGSDNDQTEVGSCSVVLILQIAVKFIGNINCIVFSQFRDTGQVCSQVHVQAGLGGISLVADGIHANQQGNSVFLQIQAVSDQLGHILMGQQICNCFLVVCLDFVIEVLIQSLFQFLDGDEFTLTEVNAQCLHNVSQNAGQLDPNLNGNILVSQDQFALFEHFSLDHFHLSQFDTGDDMNVGHVVGLDHRSDIEGLALQTFNQGFNLDRTLHLSNFQSKGLLSRQVILVAVKDNSNGGVTNALEGVILIQSQRNIASNQLFSFSILHLNILQQDLVLDGTVLKLPVCTGFLDDFCRIAIFYDCYIDFLASILLCIIVSSHKGFMHKAISRNHVGAKSVQICFSIQAILQALQNTVDAAQSQHLGQIHIAIGIHELIQQFSEILVSNLISANTSSVYTSIGILIILCLGHNLTNFQVSCRQGIFIGGIIAQLFLHSGNHIAQALSLQLIHHAGQVNGDLGELLASGTSQILNGCIALNLFISRRSKDLTIQAFFRVRHTGLYGNVSLSGERHSRCVLNLYLHCIASVYVAGSNYQVVVIIVFFLCCNVDNNILHIVGHLLAVSITLVPQRSCGNSSILSENGVGTSQFLIRELNVTNVVTLGNLDPTIFVTKLILCIIRKGHSHRTCFLRDDRSTLVGFCNESVGNSFILILRGLNHFPAQELLVGAHSVAYTLQVCFDTSLFLANLEKNLFCELKLSLCIVEIEDILRLIFRTVNKEVSIVIGVEEVIEGSILDNRNTALVLGQVIFIAFLIKNTGQNISVTNNFLNVL